MSADRVIPTLFAVAGALALGLWLSGSEVEGIPMRLPDKVPVQAPEPPIKPIAETYALTRSDGTPANLPGSWPCFRGPERNGIARNSVPLARRWPKDGPPVLWSVQLGAGHAGAAIHNGRVYVLDYDDARRRDALRCLSLADGREIWRFSYPALVTGQYGKSRTVPAVTDRYAVSFGPLCHVTCVDAKTGRFKWAFDLVREFGATVPKWGAGQCPLIDRGRAILAVGGNCLLMAVDCDTGRIVWKTPNPRRWKMTHSSVVPMTFRGRRMYLYCASGGVVGVDAETGRVLWESTEWRVPFANIPCPVPFDDGRVFFAGGYGAGSLMLRLEPGNDRLGVRVLYRLAEQAFSAEQHTPLLYRGHLYGIVVDGRLACLDPAGNVLWTTSRTTRFGRGPTLIADGLLFVLNDDSGVLTLVDPTPSGYRELARAKVVPGPRAYAPMALAAGRLLVRDQAGMMVCLDVREK